MVHAHARRPPHGHGNTAVRHGYRASVFTADVQTRTHTHAHSVADMHAP